jgi:hypothetical protein
LSWPGLTDKLMEMKKDIVALIDDEEMKAAIPAGRSDLRAKLRHTHHRAVTSPFASL